MSRFRDASIGDPWAITPGPDRPLVRDIGND